MLKKAAVSHKLEGYYEHLKPAGSFINYSSWKIFLTLKSTHAEMLILSLHWYASVDD